MSILRRATPLLAVGLAACAAPRFHRFIAGVGPYLAFTYRNLGGAELYGAALGFDLWGGS